MYLTKAEIEEIGQIALYGTNNGGLTQVQLCKDIFTYVSNNMNSIAIM